MNNQLKAYEKYLLALRQISAFDEFFWCLLAGLPMEAVLLFMVQGL